MFVDGVEISLHYWCSGDSSATPFSSPLYAAAATAYCEEKADRLLTHTQRRTQSVFTNRKAIETNDESMVIILYIYIYIKIFIYTYTHNCKCV